MSTHRAVVTIAIRAPLQVIDVPTVSPADDEVLVKVEYVASTPLDLHQNDGGLLVKHPQVLGGNIAGTIIEIGSKVKSLALGDQVFGFGWREQKEKGFQVFVTIPEYLLGKVPEKFTLQEAVTLPDNFATVFHAVTNDLGISLDWPHQEEHLPPRSKLPLVIWGASSSVGLYAIQILFYYGYRNIIGIASKAHHEHLHTLGALHTFDYRDHDVTQQILLAVKSQHQQPRIPFILDCIGSREGSIRPISRLATEGSKVAILLPVIVKDASENEAPVYSMDPRTQVDWGQGVEISGVRTHFYLENEFLKNYLQPIIMPTFLQDGIVKPNKQRIIEGNTFLIRAQKALDALRRKEVSGERLVWRVSDD